MSEKDNKKNLKIDGFETRRILKVLVLAGGMVVLGAEYEEFRQSLFITALLGIGIVAIYRLNREGRFEKIKDTVRKISGRNRNSQ